MKNVTKILTAVTLCAALFASNQRIGALGGKAALWPGDEANIAAFPAQVNNHSYVQLEGVGTGAGDDATGTVSLLTQVDGTTWGFNYGDNDNWVNMSWGNGDMGVVVGLESTASSDGNSDKSAMSVAYGKVFDFGEIGVKYNTNNDDANGAVDANLAVNFRRAQDLWLFDNLVVSAADLMADDLAFSADLFTHMDAGGADVVFGWGVNYNAAEGTAMVGTAADDGGTPDDAADDTPASNDYAPAMDYVTLGQSATIGIEANMTDWATLRVGYNWTHSLACSNGDANDDSCGENTSGFSWGLGFNWGGLTADVTVNSGLFQDPIGAITGYDDGGITDHTVTLTYGF